MNGPDRGSLGVLIAQVLVGLVIAFLCCLGNGCAQEPAGELGEADAHPAAVGAAALAPGLVTAHVGPSRGRGGAEVDAADTAPPVAHEVPAADAGFDSLPPTQPDAAAELAPPPVIPPGCVAGGLYPDPVLGLTPCPPGSP